MFVSFHHKTFSKNMAQGPRPAEAHLRSADRAQTNQMSYFQKRDGPLRFFSAGHVQTPLQLVCHAAKIGRRVRGELKRIERRIVDAGLMPND